VRVDYYKVSGWVGRLEREKYRYGQKSTESESSKKTNRKGTSEQKVIRATNTEISDDLEY